MLDPVFNVTMMLGVPGEKNSFYAINFNPCRAFAPPSSLVHWPACQWLQSSVAAP